MKRRLISAIIALSIFIPLLILGGVYFKVGMIILSTLSVYEITKLRNIPILVKILSYLLMFIMFLNIDIIINILIVIFIFMIILPFFDKEKYNIETSIYLISFILLIGTVFSYVCEIRNADINVLIYLLLITILTDTFAYLIGKNFGKHKIIEKVSPNKTYEGTIFGILIGTMVPSIFYIYMINPGANISLTILMTLLLAIIGQIGDWVFSSIKRFYNIKDFSNIMPGHGGVLDRTDSIIFVVLAYLIITSLI